MSDSCPKCGYGIMGTSEEPPGIHYLCGTWFIDGRLRERTVACYKREIANLTASRDRWKELASIKRELFHEACEHIYEETHGTWPTAKVRQIHIKEDEIITALKAAGEWEE